MIRSITDLADGSVLKADVAVIGAGLAGIELALFLGRRGLRVVLLESGRLEFDAATQELTRVGLAGMRMRTPETHSHMTPYLLPMYRGHNRIRQFGGTGNAWTGKWRLFNSWDYALRPWIPFSGWPITLEDLLPFHLEIAREYGLDDLDSAARTPEFSGLAARLAPAGLVPHLFYWEKHPTRSGARFFRDLRDASVIDVVLGANAIEIVLTDSLEAVRAIRFKSLDQRTGVVEAGAFALATGGLEVPRLLLASNRQVSAGVGNERDRVGRFFMDHPKRKDRQLIPGPAVRDLLEHVRTEPRPRLSVSFSLSEELQRANSLPNHAIYLRPHFSGKAQRLTHMGVQLGVEQVPNPDSRVFLGTERDALGMPRLVVDWRVTPEERVALNVMQRMLAQAFVDAEIGEMDLGSRPYTMEEMLDAAHHMGTTRMAADPAVGVVDQNCRVFGTTNLYVASSAVFPTGHAYSPTYTILALARRLGHHLVRTGLNGCP